MDEIADKNNVPSVKKVTLELGEVSAVVPRYLKEVWDWACENRSTHMKGCELEIITLKAISYCQDCKATFDTVTNGKKCPRCGGNNTYLVTGNETNIKSIEVADE